MSKSEPGKVHILIADPQAAQRELLSVMLAQQGYGVQTATSGTLALKAAQESAPDLILLNIAFPDMDSYEICERLKAHENTDDIPIIYVIPQGELHDKSSVFAAGASDYVAAPLHEEEVLSRVQIHLALRAMQNQLADRDVQLEQARAERIRAESEKDAAQELLREAELTGHDLLENLSDVIYMADRNGILTYVSPAIESFLGYSPPEVIDRHFSEFIHPEDLSRLEEDFQRVLSGQQMTSEYRVVTKSDQVRWMRTSGQPAYEGGQLIGAQGVLADITKQKTAEEQLRRQNEFLTSVLESLTHPFYVLDAHDYTIQMANSAARFGRLTGQTTCYILTHGRSTPCDTASHPCPVEQIKRTKKPMTAEHIHYDEEGQARNVEVHGYPLFDQDGNVVQIIEYALDITERKQAEQALRESEARWRSVTETSPDHVILLDTDLNIQFVNYASPGLTVDELIGTPLHSYVSEERQPDIKTILETVLKTTEPSTYETEYSTPGGETIHYESRVVPRTLDDQVVGLAVNARDITAHKRAQQALREAKETAEQARREEQERRQEADRRRRISESLANVLAALNSNQPLDQVLDYIALQARQLLGNLAVAIYRLEAETGTLGIQASQGLPIECITGAWAPPCHGALRQAVSSRLPVVVSDLGAAHSDDGHMALDTEDAAPPSPGAELCQALLVVPVVVKDEVYGGILLGYGQPRSFSDDETELAVVFGDQVALAIENARLRDQLKEAAATAERSRLARDLHDSVTQALFSASLVAEVLPQVWQRDPEEAQQGLEELRQLTRAALAEMRTMLLELRPTALVETRLDDLLLQLTEAVTGRAQLPVLLGIEPCPTLPPDVHVTFYRIAQEALHNVVKHAEASQVTVSLKASPPATPRHAGNWQGRVVLQVSDDGQGFDPSQRGPDQLGLGIMHERAATVGGNLTVTGQPGQGTQIVLVWENVES